MNNPYESIEDGSEKKLQNYELSNFLYHTFLWML